MRCLLLLFVLLGGLSCSKDQPPTAPAGKSTGYDLADLFDLFDSLPEAEEDTAADSTASSAPDSSVASPDSSVFSPDSSIASPDSSVFSPTAAVAIPDAALRRYLEKVLKKRRGATITHADMRKIVSLLETPNFEGINRNVRIKSLVGLEAATNLQNVAMPEDEISDLTPLANLVNLRYLYLSGNQISDITPLAHLPNLRFLEIKNNPLSDAAVGEQLPALERRGVEVVPSFLLPPDAVLVEIPDVALRTIIESRLKKDSSQPITQAEMEDSLRYILAIPHHEDGLQIKSLIGLEAATNLQGINISGNAISDVSPLANLVNLQTLYLHNNFISDVSPLANAHLPNLRHLDLRGNQISDMSPLANANLPNLRVLDLKGNHLINDASINEQVLALEHRGVKVLISSYHRTFPGSPFDIELVFVGYFTEMEKAILRHAANRWESAIQAEIPDYTFSEYLKVSVTVTTGPTFSEPEPRSGACGYFGNPSPIPVGDHIDDLRIYVAKFSDGAEETPWAFMQLDFVRSSGFPVLSCVYINEQKFSELSERKLDYLWEVALHEIGHSLGIGTTWESRGLLRNQWTPDVHFAGPQAIAAFDQAGGTHYQGAKVPVAPDEAHWHGDVLAGELMAAAGGLRDLSAITLGALSDLGYTVDFPPPIPTSYRPPARPNPSPTRYPSARLECTRQSMWTIEPTTPVITFVHY